MQKCATEWKCFFALATSVKLSIELFDKSFNPNGDMSKYVTVMNDTIIKPIVTPFSMVYTVKV